MATDANSPEAIMNNTRDGSGVGNQFHLNLPLDIANIPDYMILTFYSYKRNNPINANQTNGIGSIVLPLPISGLEDRYSMDYKDVRGGLVGSAIDTLSNVGHAPSAQEFASGTSTAGSTILDLIKKHAAQAAAGAVDDKFLNGAVGAETIAGITDQLFGYTVNPNPSLSFDGVKLKKHDFTWKFAPRSEAESKELQKIIYQLKYNGLPERREGVNFLLNFPSIVSIQIKGRNYPLIEMSNQGMFLEDVGINFMPDGNSMFFNDTGHPVAVSISCRFLERSILTRDQLEKVT